ncbi:putative lysosomal cobalamin transporter [Lobosporangium transversale]|nr:putative lysosomal cobalamin transporter [Lobosporangium transversale]
MMEGVLQLFSAWGAFGLMGTALLGFSIFFTLYYSDIQDREPFAMLVTILALTLCLSTVALFPVDIFLVSRVMDPLTGLRNEWATDEAINYIQMSVKIIYYIAYGLIAGFCFFWIPFAYFYFEELADESQTLIKRLWVSFRYTIFFVIVACTLLLTGLLMGPDRHEGIDLDLLRKLLTDLDGAGAMAFVTGVLALAGMIILVLYTAPGLSLLPLHLLAGSKALPSAHTSDFHVQLAVNRERQHAILRQYSPRRHFGGGGGAHQGMSERDRQAMSELAQEELLLEHRTRHIQRARDMPNPLNFALLKLSPYFPVDYVMIVMIILYIFCTTAKGLISLGIRILWVNLYKFRRHATPPQGLLAGTMLLMLSLAGLSYSLTMSVAPEYSMFGSQKYCNYTIPDTGVRDCSSQVSLIIPCHIGAPSGLCVPTVTSVTILKIILATPSLGVGFFYLQWSFLAMFLLALIYNLIRGCVNGFGVDPLDEGEDGEEDLEDMETRRLLQGNFESDDARRRTKRRGLLAVDKDDQTPKRQGYHETDQDQGQGQGQGQGLYRQQGQYDRQGYSQNPRAYYGTVGGARR